MKHIILAASCTIVTCLAPMSRADDEQQRRNASEQIVGLFGELRRLGAIDLQFPAVVA
jgi:hypothetical protein